MHVNMLNDRNTDGLLPRAYGLPKIHKPSCPFRLIISSIDSSLYFFAIFVHNILKDSIPKAPSRIDNSFELVEKLKGMKLDDNYTLISLDVVFLFTNVPLDLVIESSGASQLRRGRRGWPLYAPRLGERPRSRQRDRASPEDKTGSQGRPLNRILFLRLKFTLEIGGNKLNFLDVTIIKNNNKLEFDWFHEPTFSGRYLNFMSSYPLSQKRAVIMGAVDRAFILSDPKYHVKNLEFIVETFFKNDYPLNFIMNTIGKRLRSLFVQKPQKKLEPTVKETKENWFVVPYIQKTSEKFINIAKNAEAKPAFFSTNKLNNIIRTHKESLPCKNKKNVVYRVPCRDYDAAYVGQTKRQLKIRISEHRNDINHKNPHSVITEHRLHLGHKIDWEKVEVLDTERFFNRRLVSEMLHITLQNESLNLQTDTEFLHHNLPKIDKMMKDLIINLQSASLKTEPLNYQIDKLQQKVQALSNCIVECERSYISPPKTLDIDPTWISKLDLPNNKLKLSATDASSILIVQNKELDLPSDKLKLSQKSAAQFREPASSHESTAPSTSGHNLVPQNYSPEILPENFPDSPDVIVIETVNAHDLEHVHESNRAADKVKLLNDHQSIATHNKHKIKLREEEEEDDYFPSEEPKPPQPVREQRTDQEAATPAEGPTNTQKEHTTEDTARKANIYMKGEEKNIPN
ncbi:PREDICTED: uncharacterized protein LOC105457947 [Wasmannia auropunctata]|uniref:uncharacterized protein LOC105457947 n=1 Tax=Wasmannia auropunctata TaxID=64793 RepID=UPI0005ED89AC|nr:PREDICTED: uncharacterized protein LOC105457947 [Wasmannia auropunctata]